METEFALDDEADIGVLVASSAAGILRPLGLVDAQGARDAAERGLLDERAWSAIEEAGFPFGLLGEEAGGVGAVHGATIVRIAGETALSLPLAEAMGANWLLGLAGLETQGKPISFAGDAASIRREESGWRVKGELRSVPWARAADLALLCAGDDGYFVARLPRDEFGVTEDANLAGEPRDHAHIDLLLGPDRVGALFAGADRDLARRLGASLRAAQLAGALAETLTLTVGHVRERVQFGRPIAAFQAVQQLLAQMATEVSAARCAAELAFEHIATGAPDGRASAIAKIRAGEAAGIVAAMAHQLHGAIGFTREHSLHLLTRRLWSWRDEFGSEAQWSIALGRDLAASGGADLWADLTGI